MPVFRGEKAKMFLRDFANELEEQLSEELTKIKITKGLISSFEAEVRTKEKPRRKLKLLNRFIVN